MDINIAFLGSQFDSSIDNFQLIENKQDFSILMENQIDSLKEYNDFAERIESEFNDGNTLKTENLTAFLGKEFPVEVMATTETRNKFNTNSEKKDDELIYNIMFNPMMYQPDEINKTSDYIQIVTVAQTDSTDEFKYQENTVSQYEKKQDSKVEDFSQDKIDELSSYENLVQTSVLKPEKHLDSTEDEDLLLEKLDLNPSESKPVAINLMPSDLVIEGKSKAKIQSQLSVYENISEFNKNNSTDNEYIQTDLQPVIQKSEINYDPNKIEHFEKELGERLISMVKESEHQVKLKINPPELGNVDIDLNLIEEQANISFYTASAQVKASIEASIAELKNLFNEQSISLGDVQVFHQASDEGKRNAQHFYENQINSPTEAASIKKAETEVINKASSPNGVSVFV